MVDVKSCGSTILAIDDEVEILARIAAILEAAGHACLCAADVRTAHETAARTRPDLIIANVNIEGHSGIALCQQIKDEASLPDVPAMYLSASQVPDVIRRASAIGGAYYLRKPFDERVLLQLVDRVCVRSSARPIVTAPNTATRAPIASEKTAAARTAARASALAVN
jgi:DNA-binding response OmpR family regulator